MFNNFNDVAFARHVAPSERAWERKGNVPLLAVDSDRGKWVEGNSVYRTNGRTSVNDGCFGDSIERVGVLEKRGSKWHVDKD
jgi:hypothetical protein